MRYRKLGTTDLSVSVICLGTMTFGEQNSQQDGFDQMDYALERGVNFFDTAELYAVMPRKETYGKTEEILGNWFQEKKNRDKIILASKIASKSDGLEWIREGSENLGFDKKNMNAAIDASLRRLKTDYIDLYQLHWPERKVPKFGQLDYKHDPKDNNWTTIEEVLFNLNELIKAGKVRHVGLSNETPWGVMKFLEVAKDNVVLAHEKLFNHVDEKMQKLKLGLKSYRYFDQAKELADKLGVALNETVLDAHSSMALSIYSPTNLADLLTDEVELTKDEKIAIAKAQLKEQLVTN